MYASDSPYLLSGTVTSPALPYLSLSGTSMATPVVAGTVALMLQANPALTPSAVKAILQYTAQPYPGYDTLTQGAGFLNAMGAVQIAQFFAASGTTFPSSTQWPWGTRLVWGNQLVQGGQLRAAVNAWSTDVTWGAPTASGGQYVEWGVICPTNDCTTDGTWQPWRNDTSAASGSQNVVWGSSCGGADCQGTWSTSSDDGVVWGTSDNDGVVWGTSDDDGVVWGTSCSDPSCQPVIWTNQ
jgi:hypothetical protein